MRARGGQVQLRLAPCASLFHEGLVSKEANALLNRHVLGVKPDSDDQAREADQRFGELTELDRRVVPPSLLAE